MPHIPPETIEQILAATDIVEVIQDRFPLKRAGSTYKALCPFHQEKSPSFTVNPQRQIFKCFGCGAGGSAIRFVMDYEHLDFPAAARKLAERAGIRLVEAELSAEDREKIDLRRRLLALHAEAADWFHHQLLRSRAAQIARDYLKGRGINIDIARSWKIGYAPDSWDAFSNWSRERGYSVKEVVKSGIVSSRQGEEAPDSDSDDYAPQHYDRFRHRVMFPICNDSGEVIAFSGRVLQPDAKAAKYVNSPETILFTKGSVLFGLHKSKRALIDKKSAIVCEGQLDLITAFEAGVPNVIAPQGTAFTEKQAHILKRYVEEVVLCFDADAAGEKAAERSLEMLMAESLAVRVVQMPPGEDPDSLIRGQGAEAFLSRVNAAKDFFDFQLDRISGQPDFASPRGRMQAARKLAGWIGWVKEPMLREAILNKVAGRLEFSSQDLASLVRTPRSAAPGAGKTPAPDGPPPPAADPTIRLMILAALHSPEALAWLMEAPWRELLAGEPDAALLQKILEARIPPDHPAALNAFLSSLDAGDEALVSNLLEQRPPRNPVNIVHDSWYVLVRRQIRRRVDALQARLRNPILDADDAKNLQKESFDLLKRLRDIPPPLSPPL